MKKFSFVCLRLLFSILSFCLTGSGQIKITLNKETEEFKPVMHGDYEKTTDRYERAVVTLAKSGPIKYTINPELLIFENETKKWTGMIYPDFKTAPKPGDSADAVIIADYTSVYSRPVITGGEEGGDIIETYTCAKCTSHPTGGKHEIVRKTGKKEFHFTIYSIQLEMPDSLNLCGNQTIFKISNVFPEGGTLTLIDHATGLTIKEDPKDPLLYRVDYNQNAKTYNSLPKLLIKYEVNGVSIVKQCVLKLAKRTPEEEMKDLKAIYCAAVAAIRPSFPTLGKGYLGNVIKGEGLCLIINDSLEKRIRNATRGQTFCHYHIGSAQYFNSETLGIGHVFTSLLDRKGKIVEYADPWKFNDCDFRKPPADIKGWTSASWH